jgi:hypothetical protein
MIWGYFRPGDRFSCGYEPVGYSALKKAGVLHRQWCLKCGHRCWIYSGDKYRYLYYQMKM